MELKAIRVKKLACISSDRDVASINPPSKEMRFYPKP